MLLAGSELNRLYAVAEEGVVMQRHLWLKKWTPCASYRPRSTHKKEQPVNIKPETREILRQYKALINARRRDADQRELTTAQVVDEICEYMTCQCAVYIGGHFILQGGKGR